MSTATRLALFVTVIALAFGAGLAAGSALDPDVGTSRGSAHSAPEHQDTGPHER